MRKKSHVVLMLVVVLGILLLALYPLLYTQEKGDPQRQHRVYGGSEDRDVITAVVSDSGRLYVRGSNHLHSFIKGRGDRTFSWTPIMDDVQSYYHCGERNYAVTFDGTLYGWGLASYQDVTDPYHTGEDYAPIMEDVVEVAIGATTMALKSNGELWAWGRSFLASEKDFQLFEEPTKIAENIRGIYAAEMLQFLIDEQGNAYIWGNYKEHRIEPTLIAEQVREIAAAGCDSDGWTTSFQILNTAGELYVLHLDEFLLNGETGTCAVSSVRTLCEFSYITEDNRLWRWSDSEDATMVAEEVLSANSSKAYSIYITFEGTLCVVNMLGEVIQKTPMWCFR